MKFTGPENSAGHIDYNLLAEQMKEPRLVSSDRALLETFTDHRFSDAEFAELDEHYQAATKPMPSGPAATSPEGLIIKNHRRLFFEKARAEDPEHPLKKALQQSKTRPNGTYPSPAYLVRNGRLFQGIGANVPATFASDGKLVAYAIDPEALGEKDELLRAYGSSLKESPGLLLYKTQMLQEALPSVAEKLSMIGLPVTVGEVLGKRPGVAKEKEYKLQILALLVSAHGDLRNYVRSQRKSRREGSLRTKLIGDIAIAPSLPIESSLIKVGETGEFSFAAVRYYANKYNDRGRRRSYLLELLARHSQASEHIGAEVLQLYFSHNPLSDNEREEYPDLVYLSADPEVSTTKERPTTESVRNRGPGGVSYKSALWLPELAHRPMEDEERLEVLAVLDNCLAEAKLSKSPEPTEQERRLWLTFYNKIGWLSPNHPLYDAFSYALGPNNAHLPPPSKVIELARLLSVQPKGTTTMVFNLALRLTDWSQLSPFVETTGTQSSTKPELAAQPKTTQSRTRRETAQTPPSDPEIAIFDAEASAATTVASVRKCLGLDELRGARPPIIPSEKLPAYESLVESLDRDHTLEDILAVPGIGKLPGDNLSQIAAEAKQLIDGGNEPTLRWLIQRVSQEND